MKFLKYIAFAAASFALAPLAVVAQDAPAPQAQQQGAATEINVPGVGKVVVTKTVKDGKTEISVQVTPANGVSVADVLKAAIAEASKSAPEAAAALNASYTSIAAVIASPTAPASGPVNISITLSSGENNAVLAETQVTLADQTIKAATTTTPAADGSAQTTGTVSATNNATGTTSEASVTLTTTADGTTIGQVGDSPVATPAPQAPTTNTPVNNGADPTSNIPDNTIEGSTSKPK